jgi:flagellar biosynthetic protein FliQ
MAQRSGARGARTRAAGRQTEDAHVEQTAVEVVRIALFQALLLATPILGAGLLVGLCVSLFQAVTQIQEQTLTFVPKIITMILVAIFLLSWISMQMMDFANDMFTGM